jgi:hypothetical protein
VVVGLMDGFFGCECISLMCIGFHIGVDIEAIKVWGCILRCLGDGEDLVHIFVCFGDFLGMVIAYLGMVIAYLGIVIAYLSRTTPDKK